MYTGVEEWLIGISIVANITIALCLYWISTGLLILYNKRRSENSSKTGYINILFALFLIPCGTNFVFDALLHFYPIYILNVFVDILTAIVALITSICMPSILSYVLNSPSLDELHYTNMLLRKEVEKREEIEESVRRINHDLAGQVQILQNQLRLQGWITEKQVDLDSMRKVVAELRKSVYAPGTDQATP